MTRPTIECDHCGEVGHQWRQHPEARADVRAWERELQREGEPMTTAEMRSHAETAVMADLERRGTAWLDGPSAAQLRSRERLARWAARNAGSAS